MRQSQFLTSLSAHAARGSARQVDVYATVMALRKWIRKIQVHAGFYRWLNAGGYKYLTDAAAEVEGKTARDIPSNTHMSASHTEMIVLVLVLCCSFLSPSHARPRMHSRSFQPYAHCCICVCHSSPSLSNTHRQCVRMPP